MFFKRIKEMHEKFKMTSKDVAFTPEEKRFRYRCHKEENIEFGIAMTREEELDALVDLFIFTIGTVERMGFEEVFEEAFNRVMDANMKKEPGPNGKRGNFQIDLIKPESWTPPDLSDLV